MSMRILALCLVLCARADAATQLAMICSDSDAASKNSSTALCSTRVWSQLDAGDYVMSASSADTAKWGDADALYRRYADLAAGARVLTCKRDLAAELPYASDTCKDAQAWITPAEIAFPASRAHLSWIASADATSYVIRYSTLSNGPYTHQVASGSTNVDISPPYSGKWYFVVYARNNAGEESTASAEVSKTLTLPAAPTDGSITAPTNGSITQ